MEVFRKKHFVLYCNLKKTLKIINKNVGFYNIYHDSHAKFENTKPTVIKQTVSKTLYYPVKISSYCAYQLKSIFVQFYKIFKGLQFYRREFRQQKNFWSTISLKELRKYIRKRSGFYVTFSKEILNLKIGKK